MALPSGTVVWDDAFDPYDVVDFKLDLSALLEPGENIASYNIRLLSESVLSGLVLGVGAYAHRLVGTMLTLWFSIEESMQSSAAFNNVVIMPMELSITTDSTPERRKQRTLAVKVTQK